MFLLIIMICYAFMRPVADCVSVAMMSKDCLYYTVERRARVRYLQAASHNRSFPPRALIACAVVVVDIVLVAVVHSHGVCNV